MTLDSFLLSSLLWVKSGIRIKIKTNRLSLNINLARIYVICPEPVVQPERKPFNGQRHRIAKN